MVEQPPPKVRDYLTNMLNHGNSYKLPPAKRAQWADGLELERFNGDEDDVSNPKSKI